MNQRRAKPSILAVIFLCLAFSSAGTAHAVIPQLLGPLFCPAQYHPSDSCCCRYRLFNGIRVRARLAKGIALPYPRICPAHDNYPNTPPRHHWCRGLGYLWGAAIRSTVCHNNGGGFGPRSRMRNSLGLRFEEVLRVPDSLITCPDQHAPQPHGYSKEKVGLS